MTNALSAFPPSSLLLKHFHSCSKKEQKLLFPCKHPRSSLAAVISLIITTIYTGANFVCLGLWQNVDQPRRPHRVFREQLQERGQHTPADSSGQRRRRRARGPWKGERTKFEPIVFRSTSFFSFVGAKERIHGLGFCHFCHLPRCRRLLSRSPSSPYL